MLWECFLKRTEDSTTSYAFLRFTYIQVPLAKPVSQCRRSDWHASNWNSQCRSKAGHFHWLRTNTGWLVRIMHYSLPCVLVLDFLYGWEMGGCAVVFAPYTSFDWVEMTTNTCMPTMIVKLNYIRLVYHTHYPSITHCLVMGLEIKTHKTNQKAKPAKNSCKPADFTQILQFMQFTIGLLTHLHVQQSLQSNVNNFVK